MIITTKYNIGDKVWGAMCNWTDESVTCQECVNGYIKIKLTNGRDSYVQCPECVGYGKYPKYDYRPSVRCLTIGSVRYNSRDEPREQFSYMCEETGVGSGRIWYENLLFSTEEEAKRVADEMVKACKQNEEFL